MRHNTTYMEHEIIINQLLDQVGTMDVPHWVDKLWACAADEHEAMQLAYDIRQEELERMVACRYLPAQDMLAELWSETHQCPIASPDRTPIPAREYVTLILEAVHALESHIREGLDRGYYFDQVKLHDEVCGRFMPHFEAVVMLKVRLLFGYIDSMQMDYGLYDPARSWQEQPAAFCEAYDQQIDAFVEKLRELRNSQPGEGWPEEQSLAMSYLMSHAESALMGLWREEDDAL